MTSAVLIGLGTGVAAGQDTLRSVQALKAAISLTDQQSEPRNDEAKRVLKFFMSSLLNSNMPRPLDYSLMRSLTTLVPHYSEDVIYPLDANEVKARTGKDATPGKITSLVHSMEGMEISTLDFLRIQFEDEWANFVERLVENWRGSLTDADGNLIDLAKIDPATITVRDFLLSNPHGLFSREEDARMDLMMWASERGQLLARTTRGMMMYQQALELFEPLESTDPRQKLDPNFYESKFRCAPPPTGALWHVHSVRADALWPGARAGTSWRRRCMARRRPTARARTSGLPSPSTSSCAATPPSASRTWTRSRTTPSRARTASRTAFCCAGARAQTARRARRRRCTACACPGRPRTSAAWCALAAGS